MAKAKAKTKAVGGRPKEGLTYQQLGQIMQVETASILTDYIRQYVGVATETPTAGSGVFINSDRVLRTQTYQETAWYDLYAEVEKDPHISAILQTRKMAVAGMPWGIFPYDENNARARKMAEFVEGAISEVVNFNQDIFELLDAIGKGFSVSEVVWKRRDTDSAIVPDYIANRQQRRFQFDAATRALKLRTVDNAFYGDPLPERKFICHRGQTVWENPFGDALDQRLYWMWLFKKTVLSFWMKKNEVDMSCVPLVKHPASASASMKAEALEIAKSLRIGAYARIPDNFEIIWAQAAAAGAGADQYNTFVELCNAEMTKCVLGQILTTEGSGTGGSGSKALGSVHNDVRGDILSFDAAAIEGTLNHTLVRWIVDLNYGPQEQYPKFAFTPNEPQDRKTDAEVVKLLSDAGFKPTREWVMENFDVELEEETEEPVPVVVAAQVPPANSAAPENNQQPNEENPQ